MPSQASQASQSNFGAVFFLCPQIPARSPDPSPHWPLVAAFNILTDSPEISVRRYIQRAETLSFNTHSTAGTRAAQSSCLQSTRALSEAPRTAVRGAVPSPSPAALEPRRSPGRSWKARRPGQQAKPGPPRSAPAGRSRPREMRCVFYDVAQPSPYTAHLDRGTNMDVTRPSAASWRTTSPRRST